MHSRVSKCNMIVTITTLNSFPLATTLSEQLIETHPKVGILCSGIRPQRLFSGHSNAAATDTSSPNSRHEAGRTTVVETSIQWHTGTHP